MTLTIGKCVVCNRLFQASDRNRGTLRVDGLTVPVEVCDYHLQKARHEVELAQKIAESQGKP